MSLTAKFCNGCGFKFEETANTGFSMGSKNVIAGDVNSTVNHNEEITNNTVINNDNTTNNSTVVNNDTTNITNITIKDDTKESCTCSLCGKHILKIKGHTCPECKSFVCANDFNSKFKVCKKCSGEHESSHGKISSLKVLQEGIQELENQRTAGDEIIGTYLGMFAGTTVDDKIASLIENYDIPDTVEGKIAFINFVKLKTCKPISLSSMSNGAVTPKKSHVVSVLKAKAQELRDSLEYSNLSDAEKKEVLKVYDIYNKAAKKKKRVILTIVGVIVAIYAGIIILGLTLS